ncbi:TAXI family TRAP transporter solute-binding subunit [Salicibibacter halophilus]|uniref:TAXI family TRAP transporter solute-binding subunit n=1 Tax=Salicibibacter halophilus TaxID=2502791 RepID=UPI001D04DC28|nr:TAXI family TRAP transporter solute-binding subunit [Salicibibacter halophilus]
MKKSVPTWMAMSVVLMIMSGCNEEGDTPEVADDDIPGDSETGESNGGDGVSIQLGSGSTGGDYYTLGQEMANVMNEHVDGLEVSSVATEASVENITRVSDQDLELGMSVHIPALEAIEGEGPFQGEVFDDFGFMGYIYPETNQVAVAADLGVDSIADLEGMRINTGLPNSSSQDASETVLEAHGLEEDDYEVYEEGFGDAASFLQDENVDAISGLLGLPTGSIMELSMQRDIDLLSVEPEALEEIEEETMYEHIVIEEEDYDFLDDDVDAIGAYAILIGSTEDIDEELGYEIVKELYENADEITHEQGQHMNLEEITTGSDDLPLHPGAERYFEENDMLD